MGCFSCFGARKKDVHPAEEETTCVNSEESNVNGNEDSDSKKRGGVEVDEKNNEGTKNKDWVESDSAAVSLTNSNFDKEVEDSDKEVEDSDKEVEDSDKEVEDPPSDKVNESDGKTEKLGHDDSAAKLDPKKPSLKPALKHSKSHSSGDSIDTSGPSEQNSSQKSKSASVILPGSSTALYDPPENDTKPGDADAKAQEPPSPLGGDNVETTVQRAPAEDKSVAESHAVSSSKQPEAPLTQQVVFVVFEGGDRSIATVQIETSASWAHFVSQLKARLKGNDRFYGVAYIDPRIKDCKPKTVKKEDEWKQCMETCIAEDDKELELDILRQPPAKVYKLKLKLDAVQHKRITFHNPYDRDAVFKLEAKNDVIELKENKVEIPKNEGKSIKVKFKPVREPKEATLVVWLVEETDKITHTMKVTATWIQG